MSKRVTLSDCAGCRNNFYNHTPMGLNETPDGPRCWSFKDAKLVTARDVPISMPPPYKALPHTVRPNCYKASGYVRVHDDRLDRDGYWR